MVMSRHKLGIRLIFSDKPTPVFRGFVAIKVGAEVRLWGEGKKKLFLFDLQSAKLDSDDLQSAKLDSDWRMFSYHLFIPSPT